MCFGMDGQTYGSLAFLLIMYCWDVLNMCVRCQFSICSYLFVRFSVVNTSRVGRI